MAVKVADWPPSNVVLDPEHVPDGEASDWQVMDESDEFNDGDVWRSVMPTEVSVAPPVSVATNL